MRLWTLAEIQTKVRSDTDNLDKDFITDIELNDLINESIDDAEAVIHTIYEDYFLTKANIALVNGTQNYALPSDIYANKIRKVLYDDGSLKYEITRLKNLELIPFVDSNEECYQYIITNVSGTGYRMMLLPTSRETSSTNVTMWYLRNANRLVSSADTCDIPEFTNYVIQQTKMRMYEKEGHPNVIKAIEDTRMIRELMVETLTNMVPDEHNEVQMDLSFYDDFGDGNHL